MRNDRQLADLPPRKTVSKDLIPRVVVLAVSLLLAQRAASFVAATMPPHGISGLEFA